MSSTQDKQDTHELSKPQAARVVSKKLCDPTNTWKEFLCVQKLRDSATIPTQGTKKSIGYDLYASEGGMVLPWDRKIVGTGICIHMPPNVYGRIASRSGLSVKNNIEVGAGVIDADYTGEILVILRNFSDAPFEYKAGDRIAQLILERAMIVTVKQVAKLEDHFGKNNRGEAGFGSTGN